MSRILLTGGAGFIGSNLVDELIKDGNEVAVVDNLSTGLKENINKKADFFEIDITNKTALKEVFEKVKPEIVFHLAAQASVVHSVAHPVDDVKINLIGTINLMELCQANEVKKFIFSSTGGAIYGDGVERPTPEGATTNPVSPYGINKLASEGFIKFFASDGSVQATILRYANVYGPRQNPRGEAGVVSIFTSKMLADEDITIFGDGDQTRDYVFVGDIVRANIAASKSDTDGTFNIATGVESSVNDVVKTLKRLTGSSSNISHQGERAGELRNSCLDPKKAFLELDWEPTVVLDEGLRQTVEYFKR